MAGQGRLRRAGAGRGDDVADEALVAGLVLAGDHHRRGDVLVGGQHGLDLARLDPEPADLHLPVRPAAEHHLPLAGPPAQIPGPVHPLAGRDGVRAGREPLGGQGRPAHVAPGQARAGDVDLTGHPRRHRPQEAVQDVDPGVVAGPADGHGAGLRRTGGHETDGRRDGNLGRPVHLAHDCAEARGRDRGDRRRGDHVAAGDDLGQAFEAAR